MIHDKENQQILLFEKLEPEEDFSFLIAFALKMTGMIIRLLE